jgi:L-alanine-DL-glutamate epimerase-like enolase superfamily enzyme
MPKRPDREESMAIAQQIIEKVELYPIRIPYARAMQWASIKDDAASYMLLKLTTRDGLVGVGEGTVKTTWTSATHRSLLVAFEELFTPLLIGTDINDEHALARIWSFREHSLAKAMIDVAIWDLRAQGAGKPLWALWDGSRDATVSWVVTRQLPIDMAREAEGILSTYGIRTLKVKGGQGIAADLAALDDIRSAVGDDVVIYVDANRDYTIEETPDYVARVAERGAVMVEDPCPFMPNREFAKLQEKCSIPLLVDGDCRNLTMAKLFVEHRAKAFNLKLQKARGYTENWQIAQAAGERNCDVNIGLFGESSLGSLAALQLSTSLPTRDRCMPAEVSMFLMLSEEYVHEPLTVQGGRIRLPDAAGMSAAVDWDRVKRLSPN